MRILLAATIFLVSVAFASAAEAENPADKISCDSAPQLKRDAEKNDPKAETDLARLTANVRCGLTDTTAGGIWLAKAAQQGYTPAMATFGGLLYQGKNYPEARKWLTLAADKGDSNAQGLVASLYQHGYGVPLDYTEAAKWAKRSAEQGNSGAQFMLATLYDDGRGVPKDSIEADKWLILINRSESRNVYSVALRILSEMKMSKEDIAEANRRADAWKPKPEFQEE